MEFHFFDDTQQALELLDGQLLDLRQGLAQFADRTGQTIHSMLAHVQQEAGKTVRVTTRMLKRALADFDQLDRISLGSGGSVSRTKTLADALQEAAERIKAAAEPLQALDFSHSVGAFESLQQAIIPFGRGLFSGLEWAWNELLIPMGAWPLQQPLPDFLERLKGSFGQLGSAVQAGRAMLSWLWMDLLQPMGQWTGNALSQGLQTLMDKLGSFAGWLTQAKPQVTQMDNLLTESLSRLLDFAQKLDGAFAGVGGAVQAVGQKLQTLMESVQPGLSALANGAVGVVNTAISGIENAINAVAAALNGFQLEIPGGVPVLGGKKFSMQVGMVDLPSVPYLAQGAVLPANKPFLAVVGDQRNGTNIEAPLATIQQAVAQVMGQGSADTNRLLAQILTAIGEIEVGDDTIGRAARRFESRMALMGGAL